MPYLATIIGGKSAAELETNLDAFFTATPTARVFSLGFVARDMLSQLGYELAVSILYDTAGITLTTPFSSNLLLGASPAALETGVDAAIAAAPNDFWAGPFIDNFGARRRSEDYAALLITSADANAASNWLDGAAGGGALDRADIEFADSPYTVATGVDVVLADATGGAITVNLPPAANATNRVLRVKKIDASGNAVTVDGDGAETIDGAATQALAAQYDALTIFSDGTSWHIFASV